MEILQNLASSDVLQAVHLSTGDRLEHKVACQSAGLCTSQYYTSHSLIDSASLSTAHVCSSPLQLIYRQTYHAVEGGMDPLPSEIHCEPVYNTGALLKNVRKPILPGANDAMDC
ncbi:MAG: hypothetical protein PHY16_06010 [Methylobacter sp.]|nr:hypothetical protein [Methylobacter sp.]